MLSQFKQAWLDSDGLLHLTGDVVGVLQDTRVVIDVRASQMTSGAHLGRSLVVETTKDVVPDVGAREQLSVGVAHFEVALKPVGGIGRWEAARPVRANVKATLDWSQDLPIGEPPADDAQA